MYQQVPLENKYCRYVFVNFENFFKNYGAEIGKLLINH